MTDAVKPAGGTVPGIQYLRGLAALMVVLTHLSPGLGDYPTLASSINSGQTGVYIFFMISGFVIPFSMEKNGYRANRFLRFMGRRAIRIDPPYLVVIGLTLLLFHILSRMPSFGGKPMPFIAGQFIAHVFYIVPFTQWEFYNHVFWTLSVEFQFYAVVGLVYFLSADTRYRNAFIILFSCMGFLKLSDDFYLLSRYAPIFGLGMALARAYTGRTLNSFWLPVVCLALTAYLFDLSMGVILLFCAAVIFQVKLALKLPDALGRISYSLYLVHPLSILVITGLIRRSSFSAVSQLWLSVVLLAACLAAATLLYVLVEAPAIRLSKRITIAPRQ